MALVNPQIAMSYRPTTEYQPRNALAEYAQIQQIMGGQRQAELSQYQLEAAKRADQSANIQNQLYARHFDPQTGTIDAPAFAAEAARQGQGSILPGFFKAETERQTAAQALRKSKVETEAAEFGLQQKKFKQAWENAGAADTPQLAIEQLTKAVRSGEIDMASASREINQLQKMPQEEYPKWRLSKIAQFLDTKDKVAQLAVTTKDTDRGGYIERQTYNAQGIPVGQPTRLDKTLTPSESKENIRTVDNGNEVLTMAYDPVTRTERVVSRQAKALTPGESKPTISNVDLGGAVITQEYNPVTRTTRVLETRPKSLSPEQARAAAQEKTKVAHTTTDETGNVTLYNMFGQVIGARDASGAPVGLKGKPSAQFEKTRAQREQLQKDLTTGIRELEDITKDGGLIDQSTGSGAGRLVDVANRFVGRATPGDIAIGKLKPIADLPLKLIPRFEGPQSNADTTSYKEAAGQLADPTLPREIRKQAGLTVLRLLKERKGQFVTSEMAAEGAGPSAAAGNGVDTGNPLLK